MVSSLDVDLVVLHNEAMVVVVDQMVIHHKTWVVDLVLNMDEGFDLDHLD